MSTQRGFSLIEISLTSALIALILVLALPFGINAFRNYLMIFETRNIVTILRHAQTFAITNTYEGRYGVAFLADQMVLFRGDTYNTRNQSFDEIYPRSTAVTVSAPSEIVFESLSGNPNAISSIIISNGQNNLEININGHGVIDW